MLDREPDLDAARAAAAEVLDEQYLDDATAAHVHVVQPSAVPASSAEPATAAPATSPTSSSANALAANREAIVRQCTLLIGGLSTKAAERWGAHWQYQPEEAQMLAEAGLDVAALYVDNLESPWSRLYLALGITIIPRLLGPKLPPLGQASAPATSTSSAETDTAAPTSPTSTSSAEEAKAAA